GKCAIPGASGSRGSGTRRRATDHLYLRRHRPIRPGGLRALASPAHPGIIVPMGVVERVVDEVESRTGCSVRVERDAALGRMAAVDIARGPLRLHRIRIHPAHGDLADYLI